MKTKLKLTTSQVRRSVRKLMPRPCRAFSPTPSRLQFPKTWIVLASASASLTPLTAGRMGGQKVRQEIPHAIGKRPVARDSHKRQPAQLDDVQVRPVWAPCEPDFVGPAGYV